MTTSVTDEMVDSAENAFWPAYLESIRAHKSSKAAHATGMRAALEAALRSQGKVISVESLRDLPRYDIRNDGFTSSSDPIVERNSAYGEWIKSEDLTAIIGEGD